MKRREGERGAALFVVVLVVTLLTAIGVFAIHVTSLAQLSSGYSRRAGATFYLAELAMNLRLATIADDPNTYFGSKTPIDNCWAAKEIKSIVNVNSAETCVVMTRDDAVRFATNDNTTLASDPEGFFGALNRPDVPADQALSGSIRVESTDSRPAPTPLSGEQLGGTAKQMQDTITVRASLTPLAVAGSECTPSITRAAEMQWLRGYITYASYQ